MKLFSYFTISSMLFNITFSVDCLFGFDYLHQQKANIVLTKAREFAENSHRKSAASELMRFMRANKKGAFGVTNENALELSILCDLQNELGALGYTVTQTPTSSGFNYNVTFSPLLYKQNNASNINNIGQTMPNHLSGNNVHDNGEFNSLKSSIDKLSNAIRNLSQSVDLLNERLDKNDDIEDDQESPND